MFSSRRTFLKIVSTVGLTLTFRDQLIASPIKDRFTVLFQGDSITDGNRGRDADPNHILGHGYAFSIASELGSHFPERNLTFINKGVSGDKISDLLHRWKVDALDLRPNVISILVGINDILGFIHAKEEFNAMLFEEQYRQLIQSARTSLPTAAIVLGEPFILPVGRIMKEPETWNKMIFASGAIVKKLASEYNAVFIPYQEMFTAACRKAPAEYWIWDGIHPTYSGHGLMKDLWLSEVGKRYDLLKS